MRPRESQDWALLQPRAATSDNAVIARPSFGAVRALELRTLDGPDGLKIVDRSEPDAAGRVVVDVRAAGVCFPDLLQTRGQYQDAVELPAVIGSEIAGIVRSAPASATVRRGDRVWAMPATGGFAEVVALEPGEVHPLPTALNFSEGAALGINFPTAVFALADRAGLGTEQTLVVLGAAGGLGTALLAVGRHLGATTIAVVSSSEKGMTARTAGAEHVIDTPDWRSRVFELTSGRGADVVADVVGGRSTLDAVRSTAPGGKVLVLGFTAREIPAIPTNRLLLRNVALVGVGLGAMMAHRPNLLRDTVGRLDALIDTGMRPVVGAILPFADGPRALRMLDERIAVGKLVLDLSS
jgi:NADPH2:quinone reductase